MRRMVTGHNSLLLQDILLKILNVHFGGFFSGLWPEKREKIKRRHVVKIRCLQIQCVPTLSSRKLFTIAPTVLHGVLKTKLQLNMLITFNFIFVIV